MRIDPNPDWKYATWRRGTSDYIFDLTNSEYLALMELSSIFEGRMRLDAIAGLALIEFLGIANKDSFNIDDYMSKLPYDPLTYDRRWYKSPFADANPDLKDNLGRFIFRME